jgi:hypothetical protein
MAANPTGVCIAKANGKSYKLFLGFSVIAELQAEYGEKVDEILTPKPRKEGEAPKLPDLKVAHAIFVGALQRYHADEADRWLADDIVAQDPGAFERLLTASAPDPSADGAKAGGKRKAAA